jgi:hypothetical protein
MLLSTRKNLTIEKFLSQKLLRLPYLINDLNSLKSSLKTLKIAPNQTKLRPLHHSFNPLIIHPPSLLTPIKIRILTSTHNQSKNINIYWLSCYT